MRWSKTLQIVGVHAEGEVGKVVTGGVIDLPGATTYEKFVHLRTEDDSLVRFTLFEPRGCAQMSVNLVFAPSDPTADVAFIPLQPDGAHAMSGSNAMCVVTALLETGALPMIEPMTTVVLDTAAGLVHATAECRDGKCRSVALNFMPSFVEQLDANLEVDGHGSIPVDVAFGGCFFALVDAKTFGFDLGPDEARDLVEIGSDIADAAKEQLSVSHPLFPAIDAVEYALFCSHDGDVARNANVMFPGRMDRSPCGTGTAARLAVMHARGQLEVGETLEFQSIIGSRFHASILRTTKVDRFPAVCPQISGRAWIYSMETLGLDPEDPYPLGYTLNDTWGTGVIDQHNSD